MRHALERLEDALGPLRAAPLYRTTPVTLPGAPPQADYLNTAAVGSTDMEPLEVLRLAKALEREAGRDPAAERWAARPLDVDLLVYGDICGDLSGEPTGEVASAPARLTLPHPGLRRRAFVLIPLADVAPGLAVPPDGKTVAELLADLRKAGDAGGVERAGE